MLEMTKLTPGLGVEITNLDLSQPLPDAVREELNDALARNGVALIRGQKLSVDQFMTFSRSVGPLAIHSLKQYSKPGYPELMVNSNIVENGKPIGLADGGQHWHTDGAYLEQPYRTTILYAVEVPKNDEGRALGDTMFASTSGAYDALAPDMKERIAGLRAVHCHGVAREKYTHALDKSHSEALRKTVEHPVVRTHPKTGRKCLYVNPGSTLRLAGMDDGESDALLKSLCDLAVRPELTYRHNWRVGDVVMWDNCSTQHAAIGDYAPRHRLLYRTIVQGERPV